MGITRLKIENFISIKFSEFSNVKPITVMSGRTGIGKTTVLRAIQQYYVHNILKEEGIVSDSVRIEMDADTNSIYSFKIYDRPYHLHFREAKSLTRNKKSILDYVRNFDWNIADITCEPLEIEDFYKLTFERRDSLPVHYEESDTLLTALTLYIKLLSIEENSILLIDDFNLFCHYDTFNTMMYTILKTALDRNIQLIIVTSSCEVLDCIANAYIDLGKVAYFRLEKHPSGVLRPYHFSGEQLQEFLEDNWEIR